MWNWSETFFVIFFQSELHFHCNIHITASELLYISEELRRDIREKLAMKKIVIVKKR